MHSRAGAQIPFSSINYGTDTSPEGRMIIENIMLATEAGLGNGETAIFPIHIFKIKEGINYNPGDPNLRYVQARLQGIGEELFPNFSFIDAPFNLQFITRAIRTRKSPTWDAGRESSATCTIRADSRGRQREPQLHVREPAEDSHKISRGCRLFFEELERKVDLCIDQLMERYKIQASKKVKNYPFLMGQGIWLDSDKLKPEDSVAEVLKHGDADGRLHRSGGVPQSPHRRASRRKPGGAEPRT